MSDQRYSSVAWNRRRYLNDGGSRFEDTHTSEIRQATESIRFISSIDSCPDEYCFAVSGVITFQKHAAYHIPVLSLK